MEVREAGAAPPAAPPPVAMAAIPSGAEQEEIIEAIQKEEGPMTKGMKMHLICGRWWRQWKNYVTYSGPANLMSISPSSPSKRLVRPSQIDNSVLLEAGSGGDTSTLKEKLVEQSDYFILSKDVWEKLHSWYGGGPVIIRDVILQGAAGQSVVEVYPMKLTIVKSSKLDDAGVTCSISSTATVGELKTRMCGEMGLNEGDVRVVDFYHDRKHNLLDELHISLDDAKVLSGQKILLDEKVNGEWEDAEFGRSASTASAGGGVTVGSGAMAPFSPPTSGRFFGGGGSLQDDVTLNGRADRRGRSGLQNLGNTCFMNSALQCLVHTPQLMEYFLNERHVGEINRTNPLGMGGELAEAYASLMEKLWAPGASVVVPRNFKHKLSRFAPQFVGYNQQDSQELLAFLLDGLHEDLNRVTQKPYFESKDDDDRPDEVVAEEAWGNHKARNNSVIVDKFQGQYKSTLVCPECGKKSVTFDPFMYLTLQLPSVSTRWFKATVVASDGSAPPTTYAVQVPKQGRISDLLEALSRAAAVREDEEVLLAELWESRIYKWFDDTALRLAEIKHDDDLWAYRLPGGRDEREREAVVYMRQPGDPQGRSALTFGLGGGSGGSNSKKLFAAPLVLPVPPGKSKDRQVLMAAVERALRPFARPAEAGGSATAAPAGANGASNGAEGGAGDAPSGAGDGGSRSQPPSPGGKGGAGGEGEAGTPGGVVSPGGGEGGAGADEAGEPPAPRSPAGKGGGGAAPAAAAVKLGADGRRVFELVRTNQNGTSTDALDPGEKEKSRFSLLDGTAACLGMSRGSASSEDGPDYLALDWAAGAAGGAGGGGGGAGGDSAAGPYDIGALTQPLQHASAASVGAPDAAGRSATLSQCLDGFQAEEKLDPDDMWYCPRCKEHRQATKKLDLWQLPEVLVVHLKRFSYSKYWRDKLDTPVEYPLSGLDLRPYMQHRPAPGHSLLYDLWGVSNHFGGLGGGHYTAYAKLADDGRWHNFDDSSVSQVDDEQVASAGASAYLLFYVRQGAAVDLGGLVEGGEADGAADHMASSMDIE